MKLRILCVLAFLVFAFSSCEKINILDISTMYCTATINGQEYKDAPTVKEELGRRGYPFATKERIFIGKNNNLAYIQFQLSDDNGKMCYYLFGGIPFGKGENFPVLNKEYNIYCHPSFDISDRPDEKIADDYMEFQAKETSSMYPSGILVLKRYFDITSSYYEMPSSLSGIMKFTEYNDANKNIAAILCCRVMMILMENIMRLKAH
ncbi:MAG: hypothetical protein E7121_07120 [Bacteroidales bacterium]|nr:hypothetical protein [Bacteroidales bacterium]